MANILDKTDQSMLENPDGSKTQISKRIRYKWSDPGPQGKFMLIPKQQLNIDGDYQREAVGLAKILHIAHHFNFALLGVLLVVKRKDGSFWVFDGGHRGRSAFYRDDVQKMPCLVWY